MRNALVQRVGGDLHLTAGHGLDCEISRLCFVCKWPKTCEHNTTTGREKRRNMVKEKKSKQQKTLASWGNECVSCVSNASLLIFPAAAAAATTICTTRLGLAIPIPILRSPTMTLRWWIVAHTGPWTWLGLECASAWITLDTSDKVHELETESVPASAEKMCVLFPSFIHVCVVTEGKTWIINKPIF